MFFSAKKKKRKENNSLAYNANDKYRASKQISNTVNDDLLTSTLCQCKECLY